MTRSYDIHSGNICKCTMPAKLPLNLSDHYKAAIQKFTVCSLKFTFTTFFYRKH